MVPSMHLDVLEITVKNHCSEAAVIAHICVCSGGLKVASCFVLLSCILVGTVTASVWCQYF